VREIIQNNEYSFTCFAQKDILKEIKKYPFLTDINDHRILSEAILLSKKMRQPVHFITSDGALFLFAKQIKEITSTYYVPKDKELTEQYCGWRRCYPDMDTLSEIYTNPNNNVFNCKNNEFIMIYNDNDELKDVMFWNGAKYRPLAYKEFTSVLGERIKPRNIEQKMYMDLL
jgi:predicted ribonuclease YlaK